MTLQLDIDKLAHITAKYLHRQQLKSLGDVKLSRKLNSENLYDQICLEYFQNADYKNKYRLYQLWNRNSYLFSDKVNTCLIKLVGEIESVILIEFSHDEWQNEINKNKEQYGNRSKFTADFSVALSIKLQEQGIKCWIKCSYNWFKQKDSRFKNAPFWRGKYTCIKEPICKNNFLAEIVKNYDLNQEKKIQIQLKCSIKSNEHKDFIKYSPRCSGEKRNDIAKEIMSIGIMNVQTNNIIHNTVNNFKKVSSINTLSKIKSDFINRNVISNEIISDTSATQKLMDIFFLNVIPGFNGVMHNIGFNPFGYLIFSGIQLKMWLNVANYENKYERSVIWNFDATGGFLKEITGQKKPYFYTIVFHDKPHKSIILLANFITTAHDHLNISSFLTSIKSKIEIYSDQRSIIFPKIIVTDESMALVNAVLKTFNNCSLLIYLNWCFDILTKVINDPRYIQLMNVKIYLCATHLLKNMIRKIKNLKNVSEDIRKTAIFSFTLIQNSTSLEQINNFLLHTHNLFKNPYADLSFTQSFNYIKQAVRERRLSNLEINDDNLEERIRNENFQYFIKESEIFFDFGAKENLINSSPFAIYFKSKIRQMSLILNTQNKNSLKKYHPNFYFCPEVFNIITSKLHLAPLWTGLMIYKDIEFTHSPNTRLVNNNAENSIGNLKCKNIEKKKNATTSEVVPPIYKRTLAKYLEHHYCEKDKINLDQIMKLFGFNQTKASCDSKVFNEFWDNKRNKPRRTKGYFYDNIEIMKNSYIDFDFESLNGASFNEAFSQPMDLDENQFTEKNENLITLNTDDENLLTSDKIIKGDKSIIELFENFEMSSKETMSIERLQWIKNVQLGKEEWLSAVHIYYFFLLLEAQFGKEFNGFSILSEASYKFGKINQQSSLCNVLPKSLYVIHLENHWVAISNVDCAINHWKLYDSLDYDINLIKEPLKMLNHSSNFVYLEKPPVQKQNNSYDCGLFALAFLTSICFGREPLGYEYDQAKMRNHYLDCAKNGKVTMFPGSTVAWRKASKSKFVTLFLNQ